MNAPLHFKQQLADELNARAATLADLPGHRARIRVPRRRVTFTLGAVAAAVAVAVAVPLAGGTHDKQTAAGPSAAPTPHRAESGGIDIVNADYAMKSIPDGTIAVKVMSPKGIPGLQDALRQAGIPAAVMGFSASCNATVHYDNSVDPLKVFPQVGADSGISGHYSLIRPSAVPHGEHLLFVATTGPHGQVGTLQMSVVREVPNCVPESDNGIGEGYVAPGTNP
ncbi:hypothetical protein [Streptomyces sp. WM6378]|uniref:hypothetical protein n=1 Tax=Streptomyces sp. WM6378 TaxID=1415557 RepID=UPI0006AF0414|nr:hypothetical protein [Streptomyces sp. WM6378]KOU35033.1 hypothetical protein ADK54_38115 [Streptomyces sp. WM6378]